MRAAAIATLFVYLVAGAADLELLGWLAVVDRLNDGLGAVRARRADDVLAGRWLLRRVAERTCTSQPAQPYSHARKHSHARKRIQTRACTTHTARTSAT